MKSNEIWNNIKDELTHPMLVVRGAGLEELIIAIELRAKIRSKQLDDMTLESIIEALAEGERSVEGVMARHWLIARPSADALQALVALVQDDKDHVAARASSWVLATWPDPAAAYRALEPILDDRYRKVPSHLIVALGRFPLAESRTWLSETARLARSPSHRRLAVQALRFAPSGLSRQALRGSLTDEDPSVREAAAYGLFLWGDDDRFTEVCACTSTGTPEDRCQKVLDLAALPHPKIAEHLHSLLDSEEESVAATAAWAIGFIGSLHSLPRLDDCLQRTTNKHLCSALRDAIFTIVGHLDRASWPTAPCRYREGEPLTPAHLARELMHIEEMRREISHLQLVAMTARFETFDPWAAWPGELDSILGWLDFLSTTEERWESGGWYWQGERIENRTASKNK